MKHPLTLPIILATFSPFLLVGTMPENIYQIATPLVKEKAILLPKNKPSPSISFEQLTQDKNLAETTLNYAIQQQNWDIVAKLLPLYRNFSDNDPILVKYAEAGILANQNQTKSAISLYREIIAKQPNLTPIRFDLAHLLMKDYPNEAAKDQFNKVKASNAPPLIKQISQKYLDALQKRNDWLFSFDFSYLRKNDINKASKIREIENTDFIKSRDVATICQLYLL